MAKLDLPEDPILASKIVDHEAAMSTKQLEGGILGKFFGFSTEKPGNIAALSLIISFVILGLIIVLGSDTQSLTKKDQITVVAGFITLALGFVFGRTTS